MTEVFTSQREIIGTLKVTNIDFFTQKSSLPTCSMARKKEKRKEKSILTESR